MRYDGRGNVIYDDGCPGCDEGGNQRIGCPTRKPEPDIVSEVVQLRALVSRLKASLRSIEPYAVTPGAMAEIDKALKDHGRLPYEIH